MNFLDIISPPQINPQNYPNTSAKSIEPKRQIVLVAEDDKNNREELKMLLDLYSVSVLEAKSGEEAIDLTILKRPDLILINTDLPSIDGYETVRLIRAIKSFDRTPIVFLSGQTGRASRKRAFAIGGDGFYLEPLDIDRLDNILENFLFRAD